MSLLRSISAFHATSLRSVLACALAMGAGAAYYSAIDWDDVAMATSAEAVTMPPIVRASPDNLRGSQHQPFRLEHSEPTADDLAPVTHAAAPPVVTAPKNELLYTGSLTSPAAAATASEFPIARVEAASPPAPEKSMLDHAWAPAAMLVPPSDPKASVVADRPAPAPAQDARVKDASLHSPFAGRTMTASAGDPKDDDTLRAAVRSSVALAPFGETHEATERAAAPIVAEPIPAPTSTRVEPAMAADSEDSDIAPTPPPAKKPAARAAKTGQRKAVKPQGSALEEGFYSLQREISSFFN